MNDSKETRSRDAEETSGERVSTRNARDDEVGLDFVRHTADFRCRIACDHPCLNSAGPGQIRGNRVHVVPGLSEDEPARGLIAMGSWSISENWSGMRASGSSVLIVPVRHDADVSPAFRHIAVAVDFSEASERAVEWGLP